MAIFGGKIPAVADFVTLYLSPAAFPSHATAPATLFTPLGVWQSTCQVPHPSSSADIRWQSPRLALTMPF